MSEMVLNATAVPKIFFEIFPQGNVLVHIDGETMTLQPARTKTDAKKKLSACLPTCRCRIANWPANPLHGEKRRKRSWSYEKVFILDACALIAALATLVTSDHHELDIIEPK